MVFLYLGTASASPSALSYQGRILKTDGTPLEYSAVSFIFQIIDPSGQCLIYQEQVNGINMVQSGGVFDVPIGKGTVTYPTTGSFTVLDAFNNLGSFVCSGGASYNPSANDGRKLRVQFYDGLGWKTISPDNVIRSVPYAGYALSAQKLGINTAADFLLKNSVVDCNSGKFLTWDVTTMSFGCAPVTGATGGTVTNVTASAPLSVTNGTSAPHITLLAASSMQNGYLTSADWAMFNNKLGASSNFSGDVSGSASAMSVDKIKGEALSISSLAGGQYLKYNGSNWVNSAISQSDISGLSTALSGMVMQSQLPASCAANETLTFISPSGSFSCSSIAINGTQVSGDISGNAAGFTGSLSGDISGTQSATSVNKIKGVGIDFSTAPTANQVLTFDGTNWISGDLPPPPLIWKNSSAADIYYQAGKVGIGTIFPVTLLDVSGGIKIGLESAPCSGAYYGALRYNANNIEYCDNDTWKIIDNTYNLSECPSSLGSYKIGSKILCSCDATSTTTGRIWGTGIYTEDSNPCQAALHAGALNSSGGQIYILVGPGIQNGADSYIASTQNGISSSSWGSWYKSYTIIGAPTSSAGWYRSGTNISYQSGNVGIGTSAPSYKLDVTGDINTTGNFKINGVNINNSFLSGPGTPGVLPRYASGMALGNSSVYDSGFGNVAIGVVPQPTNFTIYGGSNWGTMWLKSNTTTGDVGINFSNEGESVTDGWLIGKAINGTKNFSVFQPSSSSHFVFTDSGNLGIGNTTPGAPLSFANGAGDKIRFYDGGPGARHGMGVNNNELQFYTAPGNHFSFNTGGDLQPSGTQEIMRVDGSGVVGIKNTNPVYTLDVGGDIAASGCLRSSAGVASGSCTSDERIKTDIQSFNLGLEALLGLQPRLFKYNGLGEHPASEKLELGVIAQEVEKTAPELVSSKPVKLKDGDVDLTEIKQVNYTAFTYVLINAVKEFYARWTHDSRDIRAELERLRQENQLLRQQQNRTQNNLEELTSRLQKLEYDKRAYKQ